MIDFLGPNVAALLRAIALLRSGWGWRSAQKIEQTKAARRSRR
jgi:hypothetical protein